MSPRRLLAAALLWLACAPRQPPVSRMTISAAGRDGPVVLSGIVKAEDNFERVADARVVVECTCLRPILVTTTNDRGVFIFKSLPAGKYTLQVSHRGDQVTETFDASPGQRRHVDVTLHPVVPISLD